MFFKSWFGTFEGRQRFLTGVSHLYLYLDMVISLLNFVFLSWFWRCKEHPCPLSPHLGFWRMLEVPDWGLASGSWFGYGHCSLISLCSQFRLSILIVKVQRKSMSLKSPWGALEDAGGSWFGFGIFIIIHKGSIWSNRHVLKFSFASARFQLRYLLSSVQKIWCHQGSARWVGSAKIKDQPSANQ